MDPLLPTQTPQVPQPPIPPPATSSTLSKILTTLMGIYGVLTVVILLGNNTPTFIGNDMPWLFFPMLFVAFGLGLCLLASGIDAASNKEIYMVIRILAPLVGLAAGFVVFAGGVVLAFIALASNINESGGN